MINKTNKDIFWRGCCLFLFFFFLFFFSCCKINGGDVLSLDVTLTLTLSHSRGIIYCIKRNELLVLNQLKKINLIHLVPEISKKEIIQNCW